MQKTDVTMWIPTPSMTVPQRVVLYGTAGLALVNTLGFLVLLVQLNQQGVRLDQTESRLALVEQSSVVEFLQEVPKRGASMQGAPRGEQAQYSRNKRSQEGEKEVILETTEPTQGDKLDHRHQQHHQHSQEEVLVQEAGEEFGKKAMSEGKGKHKLRHHGHHKVEVQDDMMMMMTYSMVPVREPFTILCVHEVMRQLQMCRSGLYMITSLYQCWIQRSIVTISRQTQCKMTWSHLFHFMCPQSRSNFSLIFATALREFA